jgi:hypothetical protein
MPNSKYALRTQEYLFDEALKRGFKKEDLEVRSFSGLVKLLEDDDMGVYDSDYAEQKTLTKSQEMFKNYIDGKGHDNSNLEIRITYDSIFSGWSRKEKVEYAIKNFMNMLGLVHHNDDFLKFLSELDDTQLTVFIKNVYYEYLTSDFPFPKILKKEDANGKNI